MRKAWFFMFVLAGFIVGCGGYNEKPAPTLSAQHKSEISDALRAKNIQAPVSIEIEDSGWLVATFELSNPKSAAYLENFASDALLTIRNALNSYSIVKKYRVTLNGPSPGPGLVLLYGSARFMEGGSLTWEPSKK
jgi:hypothetical protein